MALFHGGGRLWHREANNLPKFTQQKMAEQAQSGCFLALLTMLLCCRVKTSSPLTKGAGMMGPENCQGPTDRTGHGVVEG